MTRQEYIKHCMQRKSVRTIRKNVLPSVADPTMAQSGRDLLFNPKPIRYDRVEYSQGVPLEQMRSFDNMYAQKMDVFEDAKQLSHKTKKQLDDMQKKYEDSKKEPKKEPAEVDD